MNSEGGKYQVHEARSASRAQAGWTGKGHICMHSYESQAKSFIHASSVSTTCVSSPCQ
jgi:hypothetical protein